jgi:hypothetical protein
MPRAPRACPGDSYRCPNKIRGEQRYCPECKPQAWSGSTRRQTLPPDWPEIRRFVLDRDDGVCQIADADICTGVATDADHLGASDDHRLHLLRAACRPCHQRRSSSQGGRAAAEARRAGMLNDPAVRAAERQQQRRRRQDPPDD